MGKHGFRFNMDLFPLLTLCTTIGSLGIGTLVYNRTATYKNPFETNSEKSN